MVNSEREAVKELQVGEKDFYIRLFEANYKNLALYAKRFVMDTEIARDLVQDVFIYLWDKREQLSINRSIDSYLYRAVHNACINHLKRESTKVNYLKQFLLKITDNTLPSSGSEDAHQIVVHNELLEKIEAIIESLPEQCRNIFRMSRFRGMQNKEIARIYAISTRTVETQIYRALKILREKLSPHFIYTLLILQFIL